jgi:dienelactone hydrolase
VSGASFEHLGAYSDWVAAAQAQAVLQPLAPPGLETRQRIRAAIGFTNDAGLPSDVRVERTWHDDGLVGEEVSWSVGYGPRTVGWVLRPAEATGPLPAIVALHSHDGFKFYGKEKLADGPSAPATEIVALRERAYGGRAFVNALARQGFIVLAHDVFLWGSRRFAFETMPESFRARVDAAAGEVEAYNLAAREHEHLVEKYCSLLGTSLAGMVAYEDRAAVAYLRARPDVLSSSIACLGLSGGGCRAALLQATCEDIAASAIVGMMSTHRGLLDRHLYQHTWMFEPAGLALVADWPDVAASAAPRPLLVQNNLADPLFSLEGMQAADLRIAAHYRSVGRPDAYTAEWYPGPHKFDLDMQAAAFAWLGDRLGR